MNTKLFQSRFPGLAFLLVLSACSGGNVSVSVDPLPIPQLPPAQTSEPITAHGVITGFGGLSVNDVRYAANTATVTINGQPGLLSDVKLGQVVTINGRINSSGLSGTANSVLFDANVIGPVENLDVANSRLTVMGQTVISGSDTQFGAGIDPATFSGLTAGDTIQVSGYSDAAGAIRATRIEVDITTAELQLIGEVGSLDLANLLFTINGLTVDYGAAIFIDLPGGAPANGMMVRVIGTMSGSLFNVERLITAPALLGGIGQRVQTAGVITRFNSPADFDINNIVATVRAGTAFINGDASDLTPNVELLIDGDFATGGRITANRITFGHLVDDTATLDFGFRDFNEISVPTVFNVTVTQGPEFQVEVVVDDKVVDRVAVTQTGARLNIALNPGNNNTETLEAFVTMPVIDSIDLTGVVNASLNDFNQAQMTVNVGGVSRLRGNNLTIGDLTANVSGVSQLSFGDIHPIRNAIIDVSGVSQATLNMDIGSTLTGSVATGQVTGVSTLFYYGTNTDVNVATDFTSSVVRLGETRP